MTTAPDLSDHVPVMQVMHDGSTRQRCEACGWRWPCPEIRNEPRQLDEDEKELLEVLDIGVGFSLFRRLPEGSGLDERLNGGLVIGIHDDDETGRVYTLIYFDRGRARYMRLPAAEIEPAAVGLPNSKSIRDTVREACRIVGASKGLLGQDEIELIEHAFTLSRKEL